MPNRLKINQRSGNVVRFESQGLFARVALTLGL